MSVLIESRQIIGVVINHHQTRGFLIGFGNGETERPIRRCIHVELGDELAGSREFDNFAGLCRIGVDRVAIGGDEISIGGDRQGQGSAQMVVLIDDPARSR